jgi:dUTP pyrophosphatase
MKVKKLHPDAIIPSYATEGSACFDISSIKDSYVEEDEPEVFGTGLAFEIPEDHVMLIFSRSGHGFKENIRLSNCVGVIDSDFRGELKVKLMMDQAGWFRVIKGERIAQGLVLPIKQVTFEEVEELSNTARGTGGLGSTGK